VVELVGRQGRRLRSESCRDVVQVGEHPQTSIRGFDALILPGHRVEVEVGEVRVECSEYGSRRWLQAVHARPNVAVADVLALRRAGVLLADSAEPFQPVSHPIAIHARDRSVPWGPSTAYRDEYRELGKHCSAARQPAMAQAKDLGR
jgi:hypothetical protein